MYSADVLSEDAIIKWYNGGHSTKGKNVFLEQMKKMVEWLQNAEEGKVLNSKQNVSFCLYIPLSFRKVADFHFLTGHFYLIAESHRRFLMTFTKRPITGKILEQGVLHKGLA